MPRSKIVERLPDEGALSDFAVAYAKRRWPVHPLHGVHHCRCTCGQQACSSPGKHPLTTHGVKEATTDATKIKTWWHQWPNANIGIATGAVSGFDALDVDPAKGGEESLADFEQQYGALPDTPEQLTGGGGRHILFAHPGEHVANRVGIAPGLDLRGDGGYIVAAPSRHFSGGRYSWEASSHPDDLAFAPMPAWLVDLLREANSTKDGISRLDVASVLAGVPEGKRDAELFRVAAKLRQADVPEAVAQALVLQAAANCTPPFPEQDALAKVASAYDRYHPGQRSTSEPIIVNLAHVKREDVAWLWRDRIPLGKLTVLEGDPEVGKSYASLAIATATTLGTRLPGNTEQRAPAKVLILTAEDGLGDTVMPRAEDMGAELRRIDMLTAVRDEKGRERQPSLIDDLDAIEKVLAGDGFDLVIIDPLNAYLGTTIDTHRDAALRSVLTPLAALAERFGVAIICIRHLTKGGRDKPIYRGQGSIAYAAAARVVLLVGKNPDDERERVVVCIKNNLAPHPPSVAFEINDGQFRWRGETMVTAAALLAPDQDDEQRSALDEAREFLTMTLADGPQPVANVQSDAKEAGISATTLKRAKAALGVRAQRHQEGFGGSEGHWEWLAPPQEGQGGQPGHLVSLCETEANDGAPRDGDGPLVATCDHRPPGEAAGLWKLGEDTWGDARLCPCCSGPSRSDLSSVDEACLTCRQGEPAPEQGGHLVRMALDLGGKIVAGRA